MTEQSWADLISLDPDENIILIDEEAKLFPNSEITKQINGCFFYSNQRLVCLKVKYRGLLNKQRIGYEKIIFNSLISDITKISSGNLEHTIKIWSKNPFSSKFADIMVQIKDPMKYVSVFESLSEKTNLTGLIDEKTGKNGIIRLYANFLELDRTGVSRLTSGLIGLHGAKRIYYKDISSVQIKKSGFAVGFIQFTLVGGRDSTFLLDTIQNENAITFEGNYESWEKFYLKIQSQIEKYKTSSITQTVQPISIMDEITKASSLLEKGLISEEEFEAIKKKLIGS